MNQARIDADELRRFTAGVFRRVGLEAEDAEIAADVLVAADLRGVDSHGVAHLELWYVRRIQEGIIDPKAKIRVISEAPAAALLDGGRGLGMVVAYRAMEYCINKARDTGAAVVTVRNSNHFGMAAYYSMMALREGMVGLAMTNATPIVVPTFGRQGAVGTNPISLAAPAGAERPFVLDMATSVVAHGKLEVAARRGRKIPLGWALGRDGKPTDDPVEAMAVRALLPLGSTPELSSHKGYGLAFMVDILCGVLSGGGYCLQVGPGRRGPSHFFAAIRVDLLRPLEEFKAMLDEEIRAIRALPKAPGHDRIYIPGEPEFETEEARRREGIPLDPPVLESLRRLSEEFGVELRLKP